MKFKIFFMAIAITGSLLACSRAKEEPKNKTEKQMSEIIGKATPTIENGIMTPEVLYSFGRVGNVTVSPDKLHLLYPVTYVSISQNKTNAELFIMKSDGSGKKQLTVTNTQESNPQWIEGEKKIAF